MSFTLLMMAVAVSLEPFRIGETVLMIHRPRPLLQVLAVLTGGFAMGRMWEERGDSPFGGQFGQDPRGQSDQGGQQQGQPFGQGGRDGQGWGGMMPGQQQGQPGQQQGQDGAGPGAVPATPVPAG